MSGKNLDRKLPASEKENRRRCLHTMEIFADCVEHFKRRMRVLGKSEAEA